MAKVIRTDAEWFESRGCPVRVARAPRDCDSAEHKDGWQGAIQKGDTYLWLPHAHLSFCTQHFPVEDITNG
jgi:hypothetical protein